MSIASDHPRHTDVFEGPLGKWCRICQVCGTCTVPVETRPSIFPPQGKTLTLKGIYLQTESRLIEDQGLSTRSPTDPLGWDGRNIAPTRTPELRTQQDQLNPEKLPHRCGLWQGKEAASVYRTTLARWRENRDQDRSLRGCELRWMGRPRSTNHFGRAHPYFSKPRCCGSRKSEKDNKGRWRDG